VRGSLQYASGIVSGLYTRAEKITLVRSALDLTKPLVAGVQPVVQRVVTVADPWVESVDVVVTGAWNKVNSKVIEPVSIEVKVRYAALLDLSDRTVDVFLPDVEQDKSSKIEKKDQKEHPKTLVEILSKAQKRVTKRLEKQWKELRAFSAGRLKDIIHVDLIEYAENGYNYSVSLYQKNVLPIINDLSARVKSVYASISTFFAEKSKLIGDVITKYRDLSYQRYNEAYKFASHKAEEFGVPVIVGKAKEVSLEEVSQFVLVKLNIKQQNEQYVVVERKLLDLFKTLFSLILSKDSKQKSAPADQPAAAATKAR